MMVWPWKSSVCFSGQTFSFWLLVKERKKMTKKYPVTVDEVRDAQECFKKGSAQHESKNFKEAIDAFKQSIMIHPFDENHLDEFEKKLKAGNFKLQQESIGYMGCAAVHLNEMIHGLDEDQKQEVPVDESLINTFKEW